MSSEAHGALERYEAEAVALLDAAKGGAQEALARFKWELPRYRGRPMKDVDPQTLDLSDARTVVAHSEAFESWLDLVRFTEDLERDTALQRFESAVDAIVTGDVETLRSCLAADPRLSKARSRRRHHATLLHYVAANGVEQRRQQTPANAVEVARLLLDAGAEADALGDMYGERCTTMSLLVSSAHPAQAGLQGQLAELLLDSGAAIEGAGSIWASPLLTALKFGYRDTAEALVRRGATVADVTAAAGLGRIDTVRRLLPAADGPSRHAALALAAQHGQAAVVELLLDSGEDPNRFNPEGFHSHSTPLHQAVAANHLEVVKLLASRGARLDIADTVYSATPLGWADYLGRSDAADYLRSLSHT
jgi:ankyrin repeat protein